MPALLRRDEFDRWLNGAAGQELLKPAPDVYLQAWPVSRQVNSSRAPSDDPSLIEPLAA
jgi:putative SOS response-associated peptidase YedK